LTENQQFCGKCGAPLDPNTRFCGSCGQPVASPAGAAPQAAGAVQPRTTGEQVLGVIAGLNKRKGLFGVQSWNLIVTRQRLVFALMTKEMMNDAARQTDDQAKAEGKGWMGRIAARFGWLQLMVDKYAGMPVDQALAEQPENFALLSTEIKKVKLERRTNSKQHTHSNHLIIEAVTGKHEFELMGGGMDEARELLTTALGAAVH